MLLHFVVGPYNVTFVSLLGMTHNIVYLAAVPPSPFPPSGFTMDLTTDSEFRYPVSDIQCTPARLNSTYYLIQFRRHFARAVVVHNITCGLFD
jgi:hypothetical protein